MPTIYKHQKLNNRMLNFAAGRRNEIAKAVDQLQAEDALMVDLIAKYARLVCQQCAGEGNYMKPVKGCECDGPRMHKCEVCGGTGEPPNVNIGVTLTPTNTSLDAQPAPPSIHDSQ